MDFTILVNLALLATFVSPVAGTLILKPRDADVMVHQSTYFNCSTDLSTAIFWYHGENLVYTVYGILDLYRERFKIDQYVWNGTYIYNLVIHSVQIGDAGEYKCAEDEGIGEKYSVQLVVLDGDPICRSNIERSLDKVIGQIKTCNVHVEPDEVELSCSVTYHGNIPPQLEWKKDGDDRSISESLSNVISANHYNYTLKLKGDISPCRSSYVCLTARIVQEPRRCIPEVINVLYALSDNSTVNRSMDDEILCHVDTIQSCSYRWRWFENNDVTTESDSATLKPRKTGLHRCEAQCHLRNKTCNLVVMRVFVMPALFYGNTDSSETTIDWTFVAFVVAVLVTLVVIVTLIILLVVSRHQIAKYRKKERKTENANEPLNQLPKN